MKTRKEYATQLIESGEYTAQQIAIATGYTTTTVRIQARNTGVKLPRAKINENPAKLGENTDIEPEEASDETPENEYESEETDADGEEGDEEEEPEEPQDDNDEEAAQEGGDEYAEPETLESDDADADKIRVFLCAIGDMFHALARF